MCPVFSCAKRLQGVGRCNQACHISGHAPQQRKKLYKLFNIQYGRRQARILNPAKPRHQHVCISTVPSTEAFRNSKITSMWQSPKTCFLKYSLVIFGDEWHECYIVVVQSWCHVIFIICQLLPFKTQSWYHMGDAIARYCTSEWALPDFMFSSGVLREPFAPAHSVAVPRRVSGAHCTCQRAERWGLFSWRGVTHVRVVRWWTVALSWVVEETPEVHVLHHQPHQFLKATNERNSGRRDNMVAWLRQSDN